jgi:hypothetical protein
MNQKKIESVIALAITILILLMTWWLIRYTVKSTRPIVQVDTATGECVQVRDDTNHGYSCDKLPEKYIIEYVAPWWMRQEENR